MCFRLLVCLWNRAFYECVCGLGEWPCSTLETHKSVCVSWVQLAWWSEYGSKRTSASAYSSGVPRECVREKRESARQKSMHVRTGKSIFFLTGSSCVVLSEKEGEPENVCTGVCETPLFSCAVVCACLYWHQWESSGAACGTACCANQKPD